MDSIINTNVIPGNWSELTDSLEKVGSQIHLNIAGKQLLPTKYFMYMFHTLHGLVPDVPLNRDDLSQDFINDMMNNPNSELFWNSDFVLCNTKTGECRTYVIPTGNVWYRPFYHNGKTNKTDYKSPICKLSIQPFHVEMGDIEGEGNVIQLRLKENSSVTVNERFSRYFTKGDLFHLKYAGFGQEGSDIVLLLNQEDWNQILDPGYIRIGPLRLFPREAFTFIRKDAKSDFFRKIEWEDAEHIYALEKELVVNDPEGAPRFMKVTDGIFDHNKKVHGFF